MLKTNSGALVRNAMVLAATVVATGAAMAQATDPFDAAITAQTANVNEYGAALVVLAAVSVGFFIAIKYVKKIVRAA
jgi:hypothetical protein